MLDVTRQIHNRIEGTIKLPKIGAKKTSIVPESAEEIKKLAAHLLDLAKTLTKIPTIQINHFLNGYKEHKVKRALAGANMFGCKIMEVILAQLDQLAKDIAQTKHVITLSTEGFSFNEPSANQQTPTNTHVRLSGIKACTPQVASAGSSNLQAGSSQEISTNPASRHPVCQPYHSFSNRQRWLGIIQPSSDLLITS